MPDRIIKRPLLERLDRQDFEDFIDLLAERVAKKIPPAEPIIPDITPEYFFSYPADGSKKTVEKGTTQINFLTGEVTLPDGSEEHISDSLENHNRRYIRSFAIDTDKDIVIWADNWGKKPVDADDMRSETHQNFQILYIEVTEDTKISIWASTHPTAILRKFSSLMKGLDGTTLRTIAVDEWGNIIGVFKGDYAGTLKNLAVDAKGRIQAILTDPEDVFGNPHYMGAAELAARLGSINTFERRGNVIWMDDFESPSLKWAELTVGDGNTKEYTTARCFSGSTSMKLTTAATKDNVMGITKKWALPSSSKLGLEARIFCETADTFAFVTIFGRAEDYLYWGRVRWSFTDRTFAYDKKDVGMTPLKDDTFNETGNETWVPIKVVIDYDTLKYVRAVFGKNVYDLSSLDLPVLSISGVNSIQTSVHVEADAAASSIIYVDNVIFTQNEP